jgi:7-carboxy-7-deazaguanine synthase
MLKIDEVLAMEYRIAETFHSVQGEGVWTGNWMTFLRLQWCNVGCSFCDTKYTWSKKGGTVATVEELVALCQHEHVCITGGEPTLWDLEPLVRGLKAAGHFIHLETSGRYPLRDGGLIDWITISPKPKSYAIDEDLLLRANELKYVVAADFDTAVIVQPPQPIPIYLQPCDGPEFQESLARTLDLTRSLRYRLSAQLHKFIGVK